MNQGMWVFVRAYLLTTTALLFSGHASAQEVATPVFSPGEGVYRTAQSVSIGDATVGAKIYYTIDGTAPTRESTEYTGVVITISSTVTLRALAMAPGDTQGARATYEFPPFATATPIFSPATGTYSTAQTVSISDVFTGAAIYYTTNGMTPTTASTVYTGPITVSNTETLQAIAVAHDRTQSDVASATYTIAALQITESVLYSFGNPSSDGQTPQAGLIEGSEGILYGTTWYGGTNNEGTVFKVTPSGIETVLYSFGTSGSDGTGPWAGLIHARDGNFYGTTNAGGANGNGTVFKITPAGVESVLYSFEANTIYDGNNFNAALVEGNDGNFYGTRNDGGGYYDGGIVFKITPDGVETALHAFVGAPDGAYPQAALIQANDGNFYGTTPFGGIPYDYAGVVFNITPAGVETVLYSFYGCPDFQDCGVMGSEDGAFPKAALLQGRNGNFYGTTSSGGANFEGAVFQVSPAGVETVLYSFGTNGSTDGADPVAALIEGSDGNFYGTTSAGGVNNSGTVFKITPAGVETVLYSFGTGGSTDGAKPCAAMIQASDGNFFGTTTTGGAYGAGTIFKLAGVIPEGSSSEPSASSDVGRARQ